MSEEDLELLITLDDPVAAPEDNFNHPQPENVLEFWLRQPANKRLDIEVCTVTHWKDGEIVEQKQFVDLFGMQKQIGIM